MKTSWIHVNNGSDKYIFLVMFNDMGFTCKKYTLSVVLVETNICKINNITLNIKINEKTEQRFGVILTLFRFLFFAYFYS